MLDAWGWCTGKTQRKGMGREEGYPAECGPKGLSSEKERRQLRLLQMMLTMYWESDLSFLDFSSLLLTVTPDF